MSLANAREPLEQGAAHRPEDGQREPAAAWRRVLVFRCCRQPQFAAAIADVRRRHPGARIWALAHERFRDDSLAAGADVVIGHTAARITLTRLGVRRLRRLRAVDADAVVLPLMDGYLDAAANLLRVATAVAAPMTVIRPGSAAALSLDRGGLRELAIQATTRCPESLFILRQVLAAWRQPRSTPRPRIGGARRRVLHIINSLGVGGAQTQFAELVNRMPAGEFSVDVLVLSEEGASGRGRLARPDVQVLGLDVDRRFETPVDAIARVCRDGQYDIVHTWLPQANILGTAAARLAGVPRVITSVRSLNPGWYPQWCQWWYRPADVLVARMADVVTVNAQALARDHGRWALWPASRIQVVHNGLDVPAAPTNSRAWLRDQLQVPAGIPVIGCVGRLAIEKDQACFVRALAVLRERGVRAHGVLVGDGPCEPALRALVERLGLAADVTFLGARSDTHHLMAGLDLLALTSTIEGFPNVLLEAALLGVPLAASDVGGVRDLVSEPDVLFPAADPVAAARVMHHVLANPAETVERTARLQARCCQQFTADRMVSRWLTLYEAPAGPERPGSRRPHLVRRPAAQPEPTEWCATMEGKTS